MGHYTENPPPPALCFPAFSIFFHREMATEKQSEQESSTLIPKRSSPDDETRTSKLRRKSCRASQKANAMSSDDASEKANIILSITMMQVRQIPEVYLEVVISMK